MGQTTKKGHLSWASDNLASCIKKTLDFKRKLFGNFVAKLSFCSNYGTEESGNNKELYHRLFRCSEGRTITKVGVIFFKKIN